ncbi:MULTISPECIES: MobF family relaxase [unclassified Gordonia (in: high G+C Gram-positive bacteria)]|uniref:MobF family relaxase n=1 Tax=unclassified Gordonia (in: high G+C Gram-positive bacteria) TaxID=2657482 RepID=UPI00081549F3|nr:MULTISPECIES: MobF family relaxase [unclassified Gordonia (in: high G+C Gram-positive bacteria)]SCC53605.1 conjugative relaxase domain-containing protein, TrwC/TraI family [Gordonia sp. v-85]
MTATIHKLTAGDGYEYLTKSVAAMDATDKGRVTLADYYSAKGDSPGQWIGSGLEGLSDVGAGLEVSEQLVDKRTVEAGSMVSAAQMKALFGEGRHPNATAIEQHAVASSDCRTAEALAATKLGNAYAVYNEFPEFLQELAVVFRDHNLARGERWDAVIDDDTRAALRTELGRERFTATYRRPPRDSRELSGFIAQQSRRRQSAVAGYDMTFSPVKSVSALWAVAPLPMAEKIEAAHRQAVADALAFIEREACLSRLGTDGIAQVDTDGLIAAAFTHRDSRAGDPDLHTHVAISNKVRVRDAAGITRWMALDGTPLFKATVSASEVYNSRIELYLQRDLGVSFSERQQTDARKRPVREIDGVSTELMAQWSSRRAMIEQRLGELSQQFHADHGREPTTGEAFDLAQRATLETREAKHEPRSYAEQRQAWRSQARRVLGGDRAISDLVHEATHPRPRTREYSEFTDELCTDLAGACIENISATRARWQRPHLRAEAERQLRARNFAGITDTDELAAAIERIVDTALSADTSVAVSSDALDGDLGEPEVLRRANGESVFVRHDVALHTSTEILAAEHRIVAAAKRADGRRLDEATVDIALLEQAANGRELNAGQAAMVRELATSGRRVQLVLAPAGTGKTTAMRTLARAWTDSGGTLIGLAPTAAAAAVLREELDTTTDTAAKLVQLAQASRDRALAATPPSRTEDNPELAAKVAAAQEKLADPAYHAPKEPDWFTSIGPDTLVVVDEAGMASTADLDEVIRCVAARGGSVRLVGDDQQLASISAGGVLRDVAHETGALTLSQVVRFFDAAEGAASLALRDGDPAALGFYADHGRIHVESDAVATDDAYLAWLGDRAAGRDTVMLAATRDTVNALNERARADRLAGIDPRLRGPEVALSDGLAASVGDIISTRSNRRDLRLSATDWVRNGDRWRVTHIGADGTLTAKHLDLNRHVQLPADYVAEHTTLGYASTIHAAQGMTADTCHVIGSDALNRQLLYVAMTRGRHGNHIYLPTTETDPHNATTPKARHPQTGLETLAAILGRDGTQQSATTAQRDAVDPFLRLSRAAAAYDHALGSAAEHTLGAKALRDLEHDADTLYSTHTGTPAGTLTACAAWPTLRTHLATLALGGDDPIERLQAAITHRELATAADPAAVLDWRLDPTQQHSAGGGPLPWLPRVPAGFDDPQWAPYLTRRGALVTDLAAAVTERAASWDATTAPVWARPLLLADAERGGELVAELAVFRAARGVDDTDRRPAGPRPNSIALARRHAALTERADALVTTTAEAARYADLARDLDPHLLADPYWPELADHLSLAARAGLDVDALARDALADNPLPTEMPAAALWWRLSGELAPAAAEATNTGLRPDWADALVGIVGDRAAEAILTDRAWPALVAAVSAADPVQWNPHELLDLADTLLHSGTDDDHTVRLDEYARLLTWRVELLVTHSSHATGTTPLPPAPPTPEDEAAAEAAAEAAGLADPWADPLTGQPGNDLDENVGVDEDYLAALTATDPPPETGVDVLDPDDLDRYEDLDFDEFAADAVAAPDRFAAPTDLAECIALRYELTAKLAELGTDMAQLREAINAGTSAHQQAMAPHVLTLRAAADHQFAAASDTAGHHHDLMMAEQLIEDLTNQAAALRRNAAQLRAADTTDLDPLSDDEAPDLAALRAEADATALDWRITAATADRDALAAVYHDANARLETAIAESGGVRVTDTDVELMRLQVIELDELNLADLRARRADLTTRIYRIDNRLNHVHALTHTAHHHRDTFLMPTTATGPVAAPDAVTPAATQPAAEATATAVAEPVADAELRDWLHQDPLRVMSDDQLTAHLRTLTRRHTLAVDDLKTSRPAPERTPRVRAEHAELADTVDRITTARTAGLALADAADRVTDARTELAGLPPAGRGRKARAEHDQHHQRLAEAVAAAERQHQYLAAAHEQTRRDVGVPEHQWDELTARAVDTATLARELAAAQQTDARARQLHQTAIDDRDAAAAAIAHARAEVARRRDLPGEARAVEDSIRTALDHAGTQAEPTTVPSASAALPPRTSDLSPDTAPRRDSGYDI